MSKLNEYNEAKLLSKIFREPQKYPSEMYDNFKSVFRYSKNILNHLVGLTLKEIACHFNIEYEMVKDVYINEVLIQEMEPFLTDSTYCFVLCTNLKRFYEKLLIEDNKYEYLGFDHIHKLSDFLNLPVDELIEISEHIEMELEGCSQESVPYKKHVIMEKRKEVIRIFRQNRFDKFEKQKIEAEIVQQIGVLPKQYYEKVINRDNDKIIQIEATIPSLNKFNATGHIIKIIEQYVGIYGYISYDNLDTYTKLDKHHFPDTIFFIDKNKSINPNYKYNRTTNNLLEISETTDLLNKYKEIYGVIINKRDKNKYTILFDTENIFDNVIDPAKKNIETMRIEVERLRKEEQLRKQQEREKKKVIQPTSVLVRSAQNYSHNSTDEYDYKPEYEKDYNDERYVIEMKKEFDWETERTSLQDDLDDWSNSRGYGLSNYDDIDDSDY